MNPATQTLTLDPKILAHDLRSLIPPVEQMILTDSVFASRVERIFQNAMLNLPNKITRVLEEFAKR